MKTLTYGEKWIKLLGAYAPSDDKMAKALFHERLTRTCSKLEIPPITFTHPLEDKIAAAFDDLTKCPPNVLIAGSAGDGKTRILHKVFLEKLKGTEERLEEGGYYWLHEIPRDGQKPLRVHINRDLTGWRDFGRIADDGTELGLIERWSRLLLGEQPDVNYEECFFIAANDGQLLKAWQDHSSNETVARAWQILAARLNAQEDDPSLRIFPLASIRCSEIFGLCVEAVLNHPGWDALERDHSAPNDIYSPNSPIRKNRDALKDPIIRRRLDHLVTLCQANEWHLPVRNMLAILANAILGAKKGPWAEHAILTVDGIRLLMAGEPPSSSSFFVNVLGLNISAACREKTLGPLDSFRIGMETTNRADDLILFGPEDDEDYKEDYERIFTSDKLFSGENAFEPFRQEYLQFGSREDSDSEKFHQHLVAQRRRLFFRIPENLERKFNPWELTNFQYAMEYRENLLKPVESGEAPHSKNLDELIVGLNRIWTGLLLSQSDTLLATTALDLAASRSAAIEVKRIPTRASSGGEYPCVDFEVRPVGIIPSLSIYIKAGEEPVRLGITLTRYEFLRRVAAGALPGSFSRECAEDIHSFKSRLLARLNRPPTGSLKLIHANEDGFAGHVTLNLNRG